MVLSVFVSYRDKEHDVLTDVLVESKSNSRYVTDSIPIVIAPTLHFQRGFLRLNKSSVKLPIKKVYTENAIPRNRKHILSTSGLSSVNWMAD